MTTTPPSTEGPTGPRVTADELRDLGRLRRSRTDRKIAGVAGGLGRHFDIDPVILRVAFVVLVFFGGAGLLLYGAMWLIVPEDGEAEAKVHLDTRTRTAALLIAGVLAALALVSDSWGGHGLPWPIIVIGALVALALASRDRRGREDADDVGPYGGQYGAPVGPPPATGDTTAYSSVPTGEWVSTGSTGEGPGPSYVPPAPRLSRRELKRARYGPSLFLPTLAVIAVALGGLRLWELGDHHVVDGAYPALALAICGAALVVGAWAGRAGTVIWLAVFSGIALAGTSIDDNVGSTVEHPLTSEAVRSSYDVGIGRLVLDLSDVADPGELDGRTITLDGNIGQLRVIVPADLNVTASGDISGGGRIEIFGQADDGDNPDLTVNHVGRLAEPGAAHLTITTDLDFGNIYITEEAR